MPTTAIYSNPSRPLVYYLHFYISKKLVANYASIAELKMIIQIFILNLCFIKQRWVGFSEAKLLAPVGLLGSTKTVIIRKLGAGLKIYEKDFHKFGSN